MFFHGGWNNLDQKVDYYQDNLSILSQDIMRALIEEVKKNVKLKQVKKHATTVIE